MLKHLYAWLFNKELVYLSVDARSFLCIVRIDADGNKFVRIYDVIVPLLPGYDPVFQTRWIRKKNPKG